MIAIQTQNEDSMDYLLGLEGVDLEAEDQEGKTAL